MQIYRRRYDLCKRGTIRYEALYRGYATRKVLAVIKVQSHVRMRKRRRIYAKLKSATIALQCALRMRVAKHLVRELKKEQKDIGKLKENAEKLKREMASLKAMLSAQAKEDSSRIEYEKELQTKQKDIDRLEKRVAFLEEELERKKALVKQLEEKMTAQKEKAAAELGKLQHQVHHLGSHRRTATPPSPGGRRGSPSPKFRERKTADGDVVLPPLPEDSVSPEILAQHQAQVIRLEEELEAERTHRRQADGEIIKLRAAINGVVLNDSDVSALLPKTLESGPPMEVDRIEEDEDEESADEDVETRYVLFYLFSGKSILYFRMRGLYDCGRNLGYFRIGMRFLRLVPRSLLKSDPDKYAHFDPRCFCQQSSIAFLTCV
jgi:DNA repair exonuclease SbcCD ATPase subunit